MSMEGIEISLDNILARLAGQFRLFSTNLNVLIFIKTQLRVGLILLPW